MAGFPEPRTSRCLGLRTDPPGRTLTGALPAQNPPARGCRIISTLAQVTADQRLSEPARGAHDGPAGNAKSSRSRSTSRSNRAARRPHPRRTALRRRRRPRPPSHRPRPPSRRNSRLSHRSNRRTDSHRSNRRTDSHRSNRRRSSHRSSRPPTANPRRNRATGPLRATVSRPATASRRARRRRTTWSGRS